MKKQQSSRRPIPTSSKSSSQNFSPTATSESAADVEDMATGRGTSPKKRQERSEYDERPSSSAPAERPMQRAVRAKSPSPEKQPSRRAPAGMERSKSSNMRSSDLEANMDMSTIYESKDGPPDMDFAQPPPPPPPPLSASPKARSVGKRTTSRNKVEESGGGGGEGRSGAEVISSITGRAVASPKADSGGSRGGPGSGVCSLVKTEYSTAFGLITLRSVLVSCAL